MNSGETQSKGAEGLGQFKQTAVAKAVGNALEINDKAIEKLNLTQKMLTIVADSKEKVDTSLSRSVEEQQELAINGALGAAEKLSEYSDKVYAKTMQYAIRQMANTSDVDVSEFDFSSPAANDDSYNFEELDKAA